MIDSDDSHWTTDRALFMSLPGAEAVVKWFGFTPSFHDATLSSLHLDADKVVLRIKTFRMTDAVDDKGFFVLDRHAVVALTMTGVTGVTLVGVPGTTFGEVGIRKLTHEPAMTQDAYNWFNAKVGDYEIAVEAAIGLDGSIYAREIALSLEPIEA